MIQTTRPGSNIAQKLSVRLLSVCLNVFFERGAKHCTNTERLNAQYLSQYLF